MPAELASRADDASLCLAGLAASLAASSLIVAGLSPLHRLAKFLPCLSLLPLPLDGGFLIVLSPFHLLEQASLQHELLKRLERWLDLIVVHFDFHGSSSLLDASAFGGTNASRRRARR